MHQKYQLVGLGQFAEAEEMIDLAEQMIDGLDRFAAVLMDPFVIPTVEKITARRDKFEVRFFTPVFRLANRQIVR